MSIRISRENPLDEICLQLIADLSSELAALYEEDGSGWFKPEDAIGPRAAFVVAWLDEAPVGCGALRPVPESTAVEVKRMFVRQSARGRGISRQILTQLENLALEFGYERIQLETGAYQKEAIGLYETSGYERIPCFGLYTDDPLSMCYAKTLPHGRL
jgi:GNAT superfamily N-acetyltransferase